MIILKEVKLVVREDKMHCISMIANGVDEDGRKFTNSGEAFVFNDWEEVVAGFGKKLSQIMSQLSKSEEEVSQDA